jgi:hypothetical protein
MTERREYTADQKAEALGLAMSVGPVRAARQLGIPVRTVTNWTHSAEATVLRIGTQEQLAERLREAMAVGIEQVLAGLRDPKAKLGDKAQALRVVAEQHALLTGQATSRTESFNVNAESKITPDEREAALDWARQVSHASDEELREWLAGDGIQVMHDAGMIKRDPD